MTSKSFRDTLVVKNTDYIGSYKFTYNMITTITAPSALVECGQYLFTVLKNIDIPTEINQYQMMVIKFQIYT